MTIIDSGSTAHYYSAKADLPNRKPTTTPIQVQVADLPLPGIPPEARQVHVFPDLHTNLIGVTPLTKAGCSVLFQGDTCTITCPGRECTTFYTTPQGLWALQVQELHERPAVGILPTIGNATTCMPADLVAFHHAAFWSPALSTLLRALQEGLIPSLPGLTVALLKKYKPDLEATTMGHLDSRRKNVQSTKPKGKPIRHQEDPGEDPFPAQPTDNERTHNCFLVAYELRSLVYTDQTGRLPHTSSSGNNYLLIAYEYDSNYIMMEPYKNKTAAVLTATIARVHTKLATRGCKPQFHRLDNECPTELQNYFDLQNTNFQLAPPHNHRTNAAERAIRTAKNHLKAGWWSMDDQFPMYLWDKTIPHAELTLNLLRSSRMNPKLSAWEQLNGRYDFNRLPIAPPGIKVLAHAKTNTRASWATNAFGAWYIGPAFNHYRCHKVWAIRSRESRIVDQVVWFPPRPFPKLTSADLLRATIEDLMTLLLNPPTETYIGNMEETQRGALIKFTDVLHNPAKTTVTSKLQPKDGTTPLGVAPETNQEEEEGGNPPGAPALGVETPQIPWRSQRARKVPDRYAQHFSATAINPDTGKPAEYKELARSSAGPRWKIGMCKELGRLFQGYICKPQEEHTVEGTDTCKFIHPNEIPPGKKATYIRIVAELREMKADPHRVRCTVGGNLLDFPGDKSTKVAELVTIKILLNNVVSTPRARAACIDLKDFYLGNTLPEFEYVFFRRDTIPDEFFEQYKHIIFVTADGYIYARVEKGMYGLRQAGKVASDALIPRLAAAGYVETGRIPGLFKHKTNSILFALVVDDFLVQYSDIRDFTHLVDTLLLHYKITTDMKASRFCGITLQWNYEEGHVTLSMPGYTEKALLRFTHPTPAKPQHSPHEWTPPDYGAKVQYADPEDQSIPLDGKGIKRLQEVIGTFLYSARAVDNTMLVALSTLASAQTKGTEQTMNALVQLLDYAATHPDAAIRFYKSDMVLYVHSDASYLSESNGRSRVGGYFYLGNHDEPTNNPKPNAPIHIESRILKNIMAAASEAEIGGLFHNGQETVYFRQILAEIGRPQTKPTPIITDNSTADGFANKRTKVKRSKAMDMRFFWIQDREQQDQFVVKWSSGEGNHADYYTKHHPTSHHIKVRPIYLYTGCVCEECSGPDT
jgi:Reverse transcriptase (RNA-dependent DNA polymerase)